MIKEKLHDEFFIRIDEVQHGSGTSVNGNIARKCLKQSDTFAKALGINEDLVKRLSYIVLAFKQKENLNMDKLQQYCTETYQLYFKIYPWAKMNPTVHKMLRHGVAISRKFPFSLAYFAEDAAESMHKSYKLNSLHHARQNSRENRLKDIFNRAIDLSDPVFSMFYLDKRQKSNNDELPDDFVSLFEISNEL